MIKHIHPEAVLHQLFAEISFANQSLAAGPLACVNNNRLRLAAGNYYPIAHYYKYDAGVLQSYLFDIYDF